MTVLKKGIFSILAILLVSSTLYAADTQPHAGMLRYPDISATHITFVYADDIWIAPHDGGTALPLASPEGGEIFPRFSPDGKTIAFSANYDGNSEIYTLPIHGGIPFRVTYHSNFERLCDWTHDGKLIFAMSGMAGLQRQSQLFQVTSNGGLPETLPVPYGGYGIVSPNGEWLAYTPHNRDFRTWKRYRGGLASDIWLFNLNNHTSRKITDWEGTDTLPMWHGNIIYYLSDAGINHRLNIWSYNLQTNERRQITHFKDYDIKWPSNGPGKDGSGEIIFEYNAKLYILNLSTGESNPVNIQIPGARPKIRPIRKNVSSSLHDWFPSPNAKRVLVESRGDIWTLPAKNGSPRNLTRTSGYAEREPSWSPDGKWITYFSDASGENELVLLSADGKDEPKTITSLGIGYRYQPVWSPNSKWMIFSDHESRYNLLNVESKESKIFDRRNISNWRGGTPLAFSWSHDSQWIAYNVPNTDSMSVIKLYNVKDSTAHQVTNGMFDDYLPTFDRKGDFLYFFSNREFSNPESSDAGLTFIYKNTAILHAVPLRDDVSNPLKPKSDEEIIKGDDEKEDKDTEEDKDKDKDKDIDKEEKTKKKDDPDSKEDNDTVDDDKDSGKEKSDKEDKDKKDNKKKEEIKPVEITIDNFEHRAFRLPVQRGKFGFLAVNNDGHILYIRYQESGSKLQIFDPAAEKKEEKTVLEKINWAQLLPDGKKMLVSSENKTGFIDAKASQKVEDSIVTSPMYSLIDPREEWNQIFTDAWRFMRDYFYDPNMHQVDWPAVRKQYEAMLPDCVSRRDVAYVISEMISEVNAGHTYYSGGDFDERTPSMPVGYLGADFVLEQGFYKIKKFYEGGLWDTDQRSLIHQLDAAQREAFSYLFAVNDIAVDTAKAPWAAFEGLAGQTVTVTVGASANIEEATNVVITLLNAGQEASLRYWDWIESNRKYVEEKSDGKVGYIYVVNTAGQGQQELFRQFYGQMNKEALIIDERWNGGGNIADRFIELINRPVYLQIFERYENDWRIPTLSHQGPKCMMINGPSGSGGDIFPYLFRKAKLGKLIGTRTWGGVIGISKNPAFIDGGRITVPFITFYETDGTLTMEGHGVDPDIEVIDDPAQMVNGGDPQLDAAIEHMLDEIRKNPYIPAKRPAYPDRSGMGIEEDQK
jgi:tricorn protease